MAVITIKDQPGLRITGLTVDGNKNDDGIEIINSPYVMIASCTIKNCQVGVKIDDQSVQVRLIGDTFQGNGTNICDNISTADPIIMGCSPSNLHSDTPCP
jgi:nitrous oxidase accessory protein NosD